MKEMFDDDKSPGSAEAAAAMSSAEPIDSFLRRDAQMVAILPRGEALRNFVYSGVLSAINEKMRLRTLSVIPSDAIRKAMESQVGQVDALEELADPRAVRSVREILDITHGRWLWSEAAQERWRRRDVEAVTLEQRLKRASKKAIAEVLARPAGIALLDSIERRLSSFSPSTRQYEAYLQRHRATLVFNASHVHSRIALPVVHAARNLGIPTATFLFSWDNLTSQGRIYPAYDFYLVWNEDIRDELLAIYPRIGEDQVFVTGTPQFDVHLQEQHAWSRPSFCEQVGADPNRPIVLYTTGMANHMPGEPLIVEGIADMVADLDTSPAPQLLVRVYPKDQTGRFDELRARRSDILFQDVPWEPSWLTPLPEDTALWTNTLRHVDLGINVASTVSLELCMFDKPVINVGYTPAAENVHAINYRRYYSFDHYRPVHESGAVEVAWSEAEMRNLLHQALEAPGRRAPERRRLIKAMFGDTLDGRSNRRVADALTRLAVQGTSARH